MAEGAPNGARPPQYPSFFVKISSPLTQRLEMPSVFMSRHGERLGEDVLLIDRVGDTWEAKLSRGRGASWLRQMSEFGEHYSVRAGDMMVFQLVGYSQFLVTVFGGHGTEVAAGGRE